MNLWLSLPFLVGLFSFVTAVWLSTIVYNERAAENTGIATFNRIENTATDTLVVAGTSSLLFTVENQQKANVTLDNILNTKALSFGQTTWTFNGAPEVNFQWPSDIATAAGQQLEVSTAFTDPATPVVTEWKTVSNDYATLEYRGVDLISLTSLFVATTTTSFNVNSTAITVTPSNWQNVVVAAGEIVKLEFTLRWSNSQSSEDSNRYGELRALRNGSSLGVYYQHITNGDVGTEFTVQTVFLYDTPGAGTYNYTFTVRAAASNDLNFNQGTAALYVLYSPDTIVNVQAWG